MDATDAKAIRERISALRGTCESRRRSLDQDKGRREEILTTIEEERAEIVRHESNRELFAKANAFLSSILEDTQKSIEGVFGEIGSSALGKIFGEEKSLRFSFDTKGKGLKVNVRVMQPWEEGEDKVLATSLDDGEGGGIVDVIAFALRVAMLELVKPRQEGPIMLDETFKYIAADGRLNLAGEFLREVSKQIDRQVILITHQSQLLPYADRVFQFELGPKKKVSISKWDNNIDPEISSA
jgi:DNA repair exonuclease SbcCD ATPase subunit